MDMNEPYGEKASRLLGDAYSWVRTDDPAFAKAACDLLGSDSNIFLIGNGGCGKSTLLKASWHLLPGSKLVMAATGAAAANLTADGVPAVTIHKALRIRGQDWYDEQRQRPGAIELLAASDIAYLDEAGMVSSNLMDFLLKAWLRGNAKRRRKGLAPTRLILSGDVLQLEPVVPSREDVRAQYERVYGGRTGCFDAIHWNEARLVRENLTRSFRQDDPVFSATLDRIRCGRETDEDIELLNNHVTGHDSFLQKHPNAIVLRMYRAAVARENQAYAESFRNEEGHVYLRGQSGKPGAELLADIPETIELHTGESVMCTANHKDGDYQNGTFGTVIGFDDCGDGEPLPVIRTSGGDTVTVGRAEWKSVRYAIDPNGRVAAKTEGALSQIACNVARAITVHKSQGLTLDAAFMDISGAYAAGMAYIALSRLRSIDGLGLARPISRRDIIVNQSALDYAEGRLADERPACATPGPGKPAARTRAKAASGQMLLFSC